MEDRGTIAPIQALRAIAAFSVCVAHLSYEFVHKLGMPHLLPSGIFFGEVGVDIFFVISGFIIVYSSEALFGQNGGTLVFLRRRLIRIVPLYWLASTILIAWVIVAYGGIATLHWPLWTVVADYFFLPVQHPDGGEGTPFLGIAWTLFYEMLFYMVFAIAMLSRSRRASIAVTATALAAFVLIGLKVTLPQPFAYWSNPITFEFIYGMLIALALRSGLRMGARSAWLLAALGVAGLLWSEMTLSSSLPTRGLTLGLPAALIVGAAVLIPAPKSDGKVWKFALFWGEASYALYLMHPFAITVPRHLIGDRLDAFAHPYLYMAMLITSALVIAALTHLFFERPITALLKARTSKPASAASQNVEVVAIE